MTSVAPNIAASCSIAYVPAGLTSLVVRRLTFPLPPPDAKLAVIRKQIADYTQMPPNSFKLVHAGAVMKDDNTPSTCNRSHSPFRQTFAFVPIINAVGHSLGNPESMQRTS